MVLCFADVNITTINTQRAPKYQEAFFGCINNEKIPLLPLALARSHKKRVHHGLQIRKGWGEKNYGGNIIIKPFVHERRLS